MKIVIELDFTETIAVAETADLNNSGIRDWCKRTLMRGTSTNDEKRLLLREQLSRSTRMKETFRKERV